MNEQVMSDQRHDILIKAAEECIGLMNIGLEGESALAKIAEEQALNDNEVEVVATVVNNSKQLAHLQNSEPEDREKPFPLIDSENVKRIKTQPTTNAEVETGDRYGKPEEMAETSAQKQDAPDAVEIQDKIEKDAEEDAYVEERDFRKIAKVDHLGVLKEGWDLSPEDGRLPDNRREPVSIPYKYAEEEARLKAAQAKDECMSLLDKLASTFRMADSPSFARIEQAALLRGVEPGTMDLIYKHAALDKFDVQRFDKETKTADDLFYVSSAENAVIEDCVHADKLWKAAADALAAKDVMCQRKLAQEKETLTDGGSPEFIDIGHPKWTPFSASAKMDPVGMAAKGIESVSEVPGMLAEEQLADVVGDEDAGGAKSVEDALPYGSRQQLRNRETQATIESLMEDEYIGGHSLPEVVEAYNAAMSVNPNFGKAELISYMRQHLATEGAVPLDLQIRARGREAKEE